jgi:hypothetical protein
VTPRWWQRRRCSIFGKWEEAMFNLW